MRIDLSGQTALVTGAGTGIGRAIALQLAQAGARVAVHYHTSENEAEAVVRSIREMGGTAVKLRADVTSVAEIDRLVSEAERAFASPIGILVNNAGHLIRRCDNADMTEELYDAVMDLNLKSTVFMCKRVIPGMKKAGGGVIVNMASIAAHNGGGGGSAVDAASKAGVIAYSKGLAKELAPFGIRVNVVSPGYIGNTNFHSRVTSEEGRRRSIAAIPLGRQGEPEDVAGAVLFLVSGLAGFVTGETLEVNGGANMR